MKDPEVQRLERRLASAKRRALYWSGNPSFGKRNFSPANNRALLGNPDTAYEQALCDIDSIRSSLKKRDGITRKPYDPRAEFQKRWFKMMEKMAEKVTPDKPDG